MNDDTFMDIFRQGTKLLHQGRAADALPLLEGANAMDPEHVDAAINLSGAFILTGQFQSALALLEPLREREPDNPMVWTNLGAAYLGNPVLARDEDQLLAIAAFKRALEIRPAAAGVAYNIGLIYRDRNEKEQAVRWLRQAIKDDPKDQHARRLLTKLRPEEQA